MFTHLTDFVSINLIYIYIYIYTERERWVEINKKCIIWTKAMKNVFTHQRSFHLNNGSLLTGESIDV